MIFLGGISKNPQMVEISTKMWHNGKSKVFLQAFESIKNYSEAETSE